MSLKIVSAAGLSKADLIGSSDPYAVVLVNRRKVGRTRTLFKTRDPVWSDPEEIFPLRVPSSASDYNVVVRLWDEDLGKSPIARGDEMPGTGVGVTLINGVAFSVLIHYGGVCRALRMRGGSRRVTVGVLERVPLRCILRGPTACA